MSKDKLASRNKRFHSSREVRYHRRCYFKARKALLVQVKYVDLPS